MVIKKRRGDLLSHPSAVDARWRPLTAENMGRLQVPTLRNVDKRSYPSFAIPGADAAVLGL